MNTYILVWWLFPLWEYGLNGQWENIPETLYGQAFELQRTGSRKRKNRLRWELFMHTGNG